MKIALDKLPGRNSIIIIIAGIFGLFISETGAQTNLRADSLKRVVSETNDDTTRVMGLVNLSRFYKTIDLDSAILFANEAIEIAHRSKFSKGIAEAFFALGDAEVSRDSIDQAITYYKSSIDQYLLANSEIKLTNLYLILGSLYTYQQNLFEALDCFQKALKIAEKLENKETQVKVYNNLGSAYQNIEKYEEALECYSNALVIYEELGNTKDLFYVYGNLGILHATMGDKVLAETYFKKTLQYARDNSDEVIEAFALISLGDFNMDIEDFPEALNYYNEALEMAEFVNLNYNGPKALFFANLFSGLGSAYYYLKNYNEAIINLQKGFDKANETGQLSIVENCADMLSHAYELRGDYESSLKYARIKQSVSDSTRNDDLVRKVTELDMQNKFDKVIAEREFQQALNDATQKRNRIIYLMTIGGTFLGLIIFVLLFLLQKNKIKRVRLSTKNLELEKENLTNDLDYKNKELTTNVMYLLKKNELILNVCDKLKKAKMSFKLENRAVVEDVIRDLESASKGDMWKEFELRFQEVHSDFYDKLTSLFPNLTPNELKLCAFLRLNMSTKDIAAITFLSINGINIARHRLRKKLNMDKDESLIMFLSTL